MVLQRLGLPDEAVQQVAWEDLDRAFAPDHLTSIYIPRLGSTVSAEVARLVADFAELGERWERTASALRSLAVKHVAEEARVATDARVVELATAAR